MLLGSAFCFLAHLLSTSHSAEVSASCHGETHRQWSLASADTERVMMYNYMEHKFGVIFTHTPTHTHSYTHTHTLTHTHSHTHTHTHTFTHTHSHTHTHTHTHTHYIYSHAHTHTHVHSRLTHNNVPLLYT